MSEHPTTFIIFHDQSVLDNVSQDEQFMEIYRPALKHSHDYANFILKTHLGMEVHNSCFSFTSEGKYNMFLLKYIK